MLFEKSEAMSGQLDLESSNVRLLKDSDSPHDVCVTTAWDPACHHNNHVACLKESSCLSCGGRKERVCEQYQKKIM